MGNFFIAFLERAQHLQYKCNVLEKLLHFENLVSYWCFPLMLYILFVLVIFLWWINHVKYSSFAPSLASLDNYYSQVTYLIRLLILL